jgi:F0F1-type ATP synthase assembly protein I
MDRPVPAQSSNEHEPLGRKQRLWNMTLAVAAGQVGCLTLIIVITAVFLGLWVDNQFNTSPAITIILLIISVPVSLVTMFAVVQSAVKRIRVETSKNLKTNQIIEENKLGNDEDK